MKMYLNKIDPKMIKLLNVIGASLYMPKTIEPHTSHNQDLIVLLSLHQNNDWVFFLSVVDDL